MGFLLEQELGQSRQEAINAKANAVAKKEPLSVIITL